MDSSAIVCTINKLLKEKPYNSIDSRQGVVTACYDNSSIDESKWARIVADYVGADWHKVFPKKEELLNDLSDLVFSQDVPFGSTSIYAQYRVMKMAKEAGITVMLDGQGGDELFTGYTPYYHMFYSEIDRNSEYDLLAAEQKYIMNTPFGNIDIKKMVQKNKKPSIVRKYLPENMKNILRTVIYPELRYISARGKKFYKQYYYSTLNQMLYTLISYISLPHLLKYEDRNSMRFSIESRTPFADDVDLIEYVFAIPGVYKIHNGWSKYLLRESMGSFIPKQIKERTDKIGFSTPEYEWLQSISPFVFDTINPDINAILNIRQMKSDWVKILAGQSKTGITNIWKYISFIIWFTIFKVSI
jgi:asparagine synthase (glutamine-hydrolysing)